MVSRGAIPGVQVIAAPTEVGAEVGESSEDVLEEPADDSDDSLRVAESSKGGQEQDPAYHDISEEAYYQARKQK